MCVTRPFCSVLTPLQLVIPLRDVGMVQEPIDTQTTFALGLSTPGKDVRFQSPAQRH